VGVRMDALPFSPPRVWAALHAAADRAAGAAEAQREAAD
jgi:hypothetical protein